MTFFEYPVTREIHFRQSIFLTFIAYVVVTIFNFQASGYEKVSIIPNDFNNSATLWYQKFVPFNFSSPSPEAWNCTASTIKVNEGSSDYFRDNDSSCHKLVRGFQLPTSGVFQCKCRGTHRWDLSKLPPAKLLHSVSH